MFLATTMNAIVALTIGEGHRRLSQATHPSLRAYAANIGAAFIVIRERQFPEAPIGYEKLQIRSLLEIYERIIYLDTDLIVRSDTPSLFKFVPTGYFGAIDEANIWRETNDSNSTQSVFEQHCPRLGLPVPKHDGHYYNTGVMVLDRVHTEVLRPPPQFADCFGEQTYLNFKLQELRKSVCILPTTFNRLCRLATGDLRDDFILHYQGSGIGMKAEQVGWLALRDLQRWRLRGLNVNR